MVDFFADNGKIVVQDNCGPDVHQFQRQMKTEAERNKKHMMEIFFIDIQNTSWPITSAIITGISLYLYQHISFTSKLILILVEP